MHIGKILQLSYPDDLLHELMAVGSHGHIVKLWI